MYILTFLGIFEWVKSFFLKIYIYYIDYAIRLVSIFPHLLPCTQHPPLPQAIPTQLFMYIGMCINSLGTPFPVLYLTSPWLLCSYLFILNPLTSSPIPPHAPPIWQLWKHSLYPWFCPHSCLLSLFFKLNCW